MNAVTLYENCVRRVGTSYPNNTCAVPSPAPISGCGFFPVASGSFHSADIQADIGHRKLLFIGQDWGTFADFERLRQHPNPNIDIAESTGRALEKLLERAFIPLKECFFTNALFGLRASGSNTGLSPGWSDTHFVARCTDALRFQIQTIQPKAIVCLGRAAPELLKRIIPACEEFWVEPETFQAIDAAGGALISGAALEDGVVDLAILVHPSYRLRNVKFRSFGEVKGDNAEVQILKEIWAGVATQQTSD